MQVDSIILDIDGVMVDVSESYRRAIADTIESLSGEEFPLERIQLLKNAGGFNDDWELTDAGILCTLAKRHGHPGTFASLVQKIGDNGGGLPATKKTISKVIGSAAEDEWAPDAVRAMFQSFYIGRKKFLECFQHEPIIDVPGYYLSEENIISAQTIDQLLTQFNVGVLTGRPLSEAHMALDSMELDISDDYVMAMENSPSKKPHPAGLISLAEKFNSSSLVYVGDTLDDIKTVVNATKADPSRNYRGVGVLTGGLSGISGKKMFEENGADAVISTVNDLPELLLNF